MAKSMTDFVAGVVAFLEGLPDHANIRGDAEAGRVAAIEAGKELLGHEPVPAKVDDTTAAQ